MIPINNHVPFQVTQDLSREEPIPQNKNQSAPPVLTPVPPPNTPKPKRKHIDMVQVSSIQQALLKNQLHKAFEKSQKENQ